MNMVQFISLPRSFWRLIVVGLYVSGLVLAVFAPSAQSAAPYPTKPVTLICPFSAGGASDLVGRAVSDYLTKKWGQPVTVVIKTGAGGTTGTVAGLQSAPDGYTFFLAGNSNGTINPALEKNLPYKWDQPTMVARVATNTMVLIVKADSKWQTSKDLVDDVAKNPKNFKLGTGSAAGPSTFCTAQILSGAGIDITLPARVVFQGGAPVVTAVAGGHVDFAAQSVSEVLSLVEAGKIRALAVTSTERAKQLPNVPTGKEAGFPWFTWLGYTGIQAPPNLPDAVVKQWADALREAMRDSDFLKKMDDVGATPNYLGPEEFKTFLKTDNADAVQVLTKLGLRK
jgi:tripartite-type tricarboxylate transporter receptor subunit TctC